MKKNQNNSLSIKWTHKQITLLKALRSKQYEFLLFGGGMGGGKTQVMARIFLSMAKTHPETRYFIYRRFLSVLKMTTFLTFLSVMHAWGWQEGKDYILNRQEMVLTVYTDNERKKFSQIYFRGLDQSTDPDFQDAKGIEATAIGIDEANEIAEEAFNILSVRIWRCNPHGEHSFILLTCNPAQNWVKDRFYTPASNGTLQAPYYFLQALPSDNEFLPPQYQKLLQGLPFAEYQRYALGNWDYADDPNQLIRYEVIKRCLWKPEAGIDIPDALGIDVARFGGDRSEFAFVNKIGLIGFEEHTKTDTVELADLAMTAMKTKNIGAQFTAVDSVGVGGGVYDNMKHKGYNIKEFIAGAKPIKLKELNQTDTSKKQLSFSLRYRNLRSQIFWQLREDLEKENWCLIEDVGLIKELLNLRYSINNGVIYIEQKEEMKKRLGYSPDKADAVVIARYAMQKGTAITLPMGNLSFNR